MKIMRKNGFTFLELMITLSLMMLLLLGFIALQTESLHLLHQSRNQDFAMNQIQNAQESLMILGLKYFDQAVWQTENEQQLPKAHSDFRHAGAYEIVRLCWQEGREFCKEARVFL